MGTWKSLTNVLQTSRSFAHEEQEGRLELISSVSVIFVAKIED